MEIKMVDIGRKESKMVKMNDKVRIVKKYCADGIYVGSEGIIIEEFNDLTHARKVKVNIPKNDKRYWLGDKPIFPAHCLKVM